MDVFTVVQVANHLKAILAQDSSLKDIWISGEVSNLMVSRAGHCYFTLKEPEAQLRCVLFRSRKPSELLNNGTAIIAHGYVTFYEARGQIEFIVDVVVPEGTGALHRELEILTRQLESEGLFESSRKRSLPKFPSVIGLVTSSSSAVLHDITNIIGRRYPLAKVVLVPTLVQGEEAASQINSAIRVLNDESDADLIIVARGGGSLEELWPFNEEQVARAIYASRVPVVSAVGHETDFTIADYVADVRAPTPSAAAELVVPDKNGLIIDIHDLRRRASYALKVQLEEFQSALTSLSHRLHSGKPDVSVLRRRLNDLTQSAIFAFTADLKIHRERQRGLELRLQASNPKSILSRGYSVVQKHLSKETVSSVGDVSQEEELQITVSDGSFPVVVGPKSRSNLPKNN